MILTTLLEIVLLIFSLSLDNLIANISYGISKIKIPFKSAFALNIICTLTLFISLLLGYFIKPFLNNNITKWLSFAILLTIGIIKLFDEYLKKCIQKNIKKEITLHIFNFAFILKIYADPRKADADFSNSLSVKEAISLGLALSLDGIGVGIGFGVSNSSILLTSLISFILGLTFTYLGYYLGKLLKKHINLDFSYLSGITLIILALFKI